MNDPVPPDASELTAKQNYFQRVKSDTDRYQAHLHANRSYYNLTIKKDSTKLEKHRRASREYARKRRLQDYLEKKGIKIMYLLFAGGTYYPTGGAACDLVGPYKKLEHATSEGKTLEADDRVAWWHVYGIVENKIVAHGGDHPDEAVEHLPADKK